MHKKLIGLLAALMIAPSMAFSAPLDPREADAICKSTPPLGTSFDECTHHVDAIDFHSYVVSVDFPDDPVSPPVQLTLSDGMPPQTVESLSGVKRTKIEIYAGHSVGGNLLFAEARELDFENGEQVAGSGIKELDLILGKPQAGILATGRPVVFTLLNVKE